MDNKNNEIYIISEYLINNLDFSFQESYNLKKLIDDAKEKNNIIININTKDICDNINNKNLSIFCEKDRNGKYFITDNENILKKTKIIIYSTILLFLIFSFFYNTLNELIFFTNSFNVSTASTASSISSLELNFLLGGSIFLCVYFKNKNFYFLIITASLIPFIKSQNPIFILFFLLLYLFTTNDKRNIKEMNKERLQFIYSTLALFSIFFSEYYINIEIYMITKILFVLILLSYVYINKLTIIHFSVFLVISFTIYKLIENIIYTLNDKNIIFFPYKDYINLEFSIISIALTIILFTFSYIIKFLKIILYNISTKEKIFIILIYFTLFILKIFLNESAIILYPILNFFIKVLLLFFIFLLFYKISELKTKKEVKSLFKIKEQKRNKFINYFYSIFENNKEIINKTKRSKFLDYIEYFYSTFENNQKLKFNEKLYLINFSFILISSLTIFNFIFNYNHRVHFINNNTECINFKDKQILKNERSNYYFIYNKFNHFEEQVKENEYILYSKKLDVDESFFIKKEKCEKKT